MPTFDVINELEGPEFSAEMNLAAGRKAFIRHLQGHPLFNGLLEAVRTEKGADTVIRRISELVAKEIDVSYEHPADVAFCAYLTALAIAGRPEVTSAAAKVLQGARNCSWAIDIAKQYLSKHWIRPQESSNSVRLEVLGNFAFFETRPVMKATTSFFEDAILRADLRSIPPASSVGAIQENWTAGIFGNPIEFGSEGRPTATVPGRVIAATMKLTA